MKAETCSRCGYRPLVPGAPATCVEARDQLFAMTWSLPRPPFLHQLATDAYSSQHLHTTQSPISKLFPLMGLYLATELGTTGYEIQLAHQEKSLDPSRSEWPDLVIPPIAFTMHVGHVLAEHDRELEAIVKEWVSTTWKALGFARESIRTFCST